MIYHKQTNNSIFIESNQTEITFAIASKCFLVLFNVIFSSSHKQLDLYGMTQKNVRELFLRLCDQTE